MEYNEQSIRVLTEDEINRFDWHYAELLAKEHLLPLEWVQRRFEASNRLGMQPDYFVRRYITQEETEEVPEFVVVFSEILWEVRDEAMTPKRAKPKLKAMPQHNVELARKLVNGDVPVAEVAKKLGVSTAAPCAAPVQDDE